MQVLGEENTRAYDGPSDAMVAAFILAREDYWKGQQSGAWRSEFLAVKEGLRAALARMRDDGAVAKGRFGPFSGLNCAIPGASPASSGPGGSTAAGS